jgi:acyl-CoA thioester hydrolase
MRWADLDLLGHVNNVTYLDYLQEARVDMMRAQQTRGEEADQVAGTLVVRHEVSYVRPLLFDYGPILVECWVTEIRAASFTLAYEVFRPAADRPGERLVFCRATTVLTPYLFDEQRPRRLAAAEREGLEVFLEPGEPVRAPRLPSVRQASDNHFEVSVRFSDLDVYGHVNNVKYVEYFQESRLVYLTRRLWTGLPEDVPPADVVVAQTDIDYRRPILFRAEPYDCWSQMLRVGDKSAAILSEIRDGEDLLARAVVTFVFVDKHTGRSAPPHPAHRATLAAGLLEGSA